MDRCERRRHDLVPGVIMRVYCWVAIGGCVGVFGCGNQAQPQAAEPAPPVVVAAVPTPAPVEPAPDPLPAPVPAPPAPKPMPVQLPDDPGGELLGKVLEPPLPALPPIPRVTAPRPRVSDAERGELPLPPIPAETVSLPDPPRTIPDPTPPPEGIPSDLPRTGAPTPQEVSLCLVRGCQPLRRIR